MTTEMKAAKLQEILKRAAKRQNQDADEAHKEQQVKDRLNKVREGAEDG